ncbi:hypothetical protein B0G62_10617 [Paraburkholderia eburnea]|uniref:Uncharacterized protein n=1 Tax=Paraburkholderia eburnea TaxID=1189126 RepID=A0A2S4M9S5_9BURK|nr:hypothetical protein B0G62_10617 [Paraburkholderia eburnea]PRZ22519.1 hypothetical protein BX588_10617 [Paraburkholderia eburnea]
MLFSCLQVPWRLNQWTRLVVWLPASVWQRIHCALSAELRRRGEIDLSRTVRRHQREGKSMPIAAIGIDLAKNVFTGHGVDETGKAMQIKPHVPRSVEDLDRAVACVPHWHRSVLQRTGALGGHAPNAPQHRASTQFVIFRCILRNHVPADSGCLRRELPCMINDFDVRTRQVRKTRNSRHPDSSTAVAPGVRD